MVKLTKVYISTISTPLASIGEIMPIVEAFFDSEKAAKRAKKQNMLGGVVREICPDDYAITIFLEMGIIAILAKGFKHYQQAKEALPPLKAIMRNTHFEIVKFCETALYKHNIIQEGKND